MRTSTTSSRDEAGLRSSAALASTLLMLLVGYAFLMAVPHVLSRFPTGSLAVLSGAAWAPAAAAFGLLALGIAAFVFALTRIVRDMESEPYACLAPVLAVFAASVLIGLRVKLPFPGLAADHFSVLAVTVAVVGGALLQRGGVAMFMLGALLASLPAATLFCAAWAASGVADAVAFWTSVEPRLRIYVGLLASSSIVMLGVAIVARASTPRTRGEADEPVSLPRSQPQLPQGEYRHEEDSAALWRRLQAQSEAAPPRLRSVPSRGVQAQVSAALDSIDIERLTWSGGFPAEDHREPASSGTPKWLMAVLAVTALGALGAFGYRAHLWNQNRLHVAALAAEVELSRAAQKKAAEQAVRAKEAEAAAQRLEAMLAAPPAPPAAPIEAAPAVATEAEAEPEVEAKAEEARKLAAADEPRERREDRARRREARREKKEREVDARLRAKEQKKARAERDAARANERAVSGAMSASNDPIFGL